MSLFILISQYTNDLLTTIQWLKMMNTWVDSCCFAFHQLCKDTTDMLMCPIEEYLAAQVSPQITFQWQFPSMYTPARLHESVDMQKHGQLDWTMPSYLPSVEWTYRTHPATTPLHIQDPDKDWMGSISMWRHYQGMVKTNWHLLLHESSSPEQWMLIPIKELWMFSIIIWKQKNMVLHETKIAPILLEKCWEETSTKAASVFQATWRKILHQVTASFFTTKVSKQFQHGQRRTLMHIWHCQLGAPTITLSVPQAALGKKFHGGQALFTTTILLNWF